MSSRFPAVALLAALAFAGCDSGGGDCDPAPVSAAPGTFALQFEEDTGCFTLRGSDARFGVNAPLYSDDPTVYGLLVPDDTVTVEGVPTSFIELLAVGDGPLPVGAYDVADLFTRSAVASAPPAGDARLLEYPGAVALAAIIDRDEVLFSREGTLTVTRSSPTAFEGRVDAVMAAQESEGGRDVPGAVVRVRGAFSLGPNADPFIVIN